MLIHGLHATGPKVGLRINLGHYPGVEHEGCVM